MYTNYHRLGSLKQLTLLSYSYGSLKLEMGLTVLKSSWATFLLEALREDLFFLLFPASRSYLYCLAAFPSSNCKARSSTALSLSLIHTSLFPWARFLWLWHSCLPLIRTHNFIHFTCKIQAYFPILRPLTKSYLKNSFFLCNTTYSQV